MATQTQLDKLHIAWEATRTRVNVTIPNLGSRLRAIRTKLNPPDRNGGA